MNLPALFKVDGDVTGISRAKQYEVKLHHFLVDVEDDAKVFVAQGYHLVMEGEAAIKHFAELGKKEVKETPKPTPPKSNPKTPAKS